MGAVVARPTSSRLPRASGDEWCAESLGPTALLQVCWSTTAISSRDAAAPTAATMSASAAHGEPAGAAEPPEASRLEGSKQTSVGLHAVGCQRHKHRLDDDLLIEATMLTCSRCC